MIILNEFDDRFETKLLIGGYDVSVSIDKPISESELSIFNKIVNNSALGLLNKSIGYMNELKNEYGISYIDDFSEPGIIGDGDIISVYWSSEKGEANGESTIGVDFTIIDLTPIDITIGD